MPYNVMTKDLVTLIAEFGIPSAAVGLAALTSKLAKPAEFTTIWGESYIWDREALAKLPEDRLVALLTGLRDMVGMQ
jgi:hypothetical protein